MTAPVVELLPWFGSAALLLVIGYLIAYREATMLVAGYDESSDVPADVAAELVGTLTLGVGVATAAVGVALTLTDAFGLVVVGYTALVVAATVATVYRLWTYPSPESN